MPRTRDQAGFSLKETSLTWSRLASSSRRQRATLLRVKGKTKRAIFKGWTLQPQQRQRAKLQPRERQASWTPYEQQNQTSSLNERAPEPIPGRQQWLRGRWAQHWFYWWINHPDEGSFRGCDFTVRLIKKPNRGGHTFAPMAFGLCHIMLPIKASCQADLVKRT